MTTPQDYGPVFSNMVDILSKMQDRLIKLGPAPNKYAMITVDPGGYTFDPAGYKYFSLFSNAPAILYGEALGIKMPYRLQVGYNTLTNIPPNTIFKTLSGSMSFLAAWSDTQPSVNDVQLSGSDVILADNVTTTGRVDNGQSSGWDTSLRLNVWGTASSFAAQVQGQMYDGAWYSLTPYDVIAGATLGSPNITAAGIYDIDVTGFQKIAFNVSALADGNINAKGVQLP